MVGIEGDGGFSLSCNRYREMLAILILQVNVLAHLQLLRTRKIRNFHIEDSIRVCLTVSLLRH